MRYVHPREETVRKLFVRLGGLERVSPACAGSVQNQVQLNSAPAQDCAKSLLHSGLQRAEVVELADTPS